MGSAISVVSPSAEGSESSAKGQASEAQRAAARQEREAEKAAQKAAKEQATAERTARKETKRIELANKKKELADQKEQETKKLLAELQAAAEASRADDEFIRSNDKVTAERAEKAGNRFIAIEPKLKLLRPKIGFKRWIETVVLIKYGRARLYMAVAKAIAADPSLREFGLTEIYEILGLVTRKKAKGGPANNNGAAGAGEASGVGTDSGASTSSETGNSGANAGTAGEEAQQKQRPNITVGSLEAHYHGGCNVIELDDNWSEALADAVADVANFEQVLHGRGVLLRLKSGAGQAE